MSKKQGQNIKQSQWNTKKEGKKEIETIIWRRENIKREYGSNRHQNRSKENKQKLKECQKNYQDAKKSK